jgi:hypothetical protein
MLSTQALLRHVSSLDSICQCSILVRPNYQLEPSLIIIVAKALHAGSIYQDLLRKRLVGKNILFFCSFFVIIFIEGRIYMGNTL